MASTEQIDKWLEAAKGGYTTEELNAAFDQVADPENWKMPISADIPADCDIKLIDHAVTFFAGCMAEIIEIRDAEGMLAGYHVEAAGYYNSVGS
jgi:hypothetical protein